MTGVDPARLTGTPAAAGPVTTGQDKAGPDKAGPARWDVETLCGPAGEAILVHKGEHYRLRVTSRGRLILTK